MLLWKQKKDEIEKVTNFQIVHFQKNKEYNKNLEPFIVRFTEHETVPSLKT